MRHIQLSLVLLFVCASGLSQERISIRTKYKKIPRTIVLDTLNFTKKSDYTLHIQKITSSTEILHKKGDSVAIEKEVVVNGIKTRVTTDYKVKLEKDIKRTKKDTVDCTECPDKTRKASVKLTGDKLYINYLLDGDKQQQISITDSSSTKSIDRNESYFFKLKNRQTLSLKHNGWIISGLTIPLKYRFSTERRGQEISDDFSASINLNAMISYTLLGRSKFTYLKNLDNSIRDFSWTLGGFVGASTLTLNSRNTVSAGEDRIPAGEQLNQGLFSIGLGTSFNYNSFSVGLFYGHDFGLGQDTGRLWDFEGKPFIGVALGIEVLKLGRASAQ
ncbi:MAG: hypothetical protein AAF489_06700 [Bacteroidota bacterium]